MILHFLLLPLLAVDLAVAMFQQDQLMVEMVAPVAAG
jgi:hypothetical protein